MTVSSNKLEMKATLYPWGPRQCAERRNSFGPRTHPVACRGGSPIVDWKAGSMSAHPSGALEMNQGGPAFSEEYGNRGTEQNKGFHLDAQFYSLA